MKGFLPNWSFHEPYLIIFSKQFILGSQEQGMWTCVSNVELWSIKAL